MSINPNQALQFMGADCPWEDAKWVLVGLPYDGTCSYRPGARFAPNAIREASWGLETYSPCLDRDLEEVRYADAGNLDLPFGNREVVLDRIHQATQWILAQRKGWIGIGGEHLITLPAIQAHLAHYPNLALLHFDAHADLRENYLGESLSHAAVMRRVIELIGPERYAQVGIRSGTREEWRWMRTHQTLLQTPGDLSRKLTLWGGRPIFLTIDLDVLDPGIFPGTGTPEPGGLTFTELQDWLYCLKGLPIIGFDVVELSPPYDPSGVSSITAAKVIRECLLLAPRSDASPGNPAG